ncbi:asparaginase [Sulfobacillus harzensis]|uniref:Asparaginase n=1 Tax=Sulfobacillus harzensis TaxID=2729629 RepID=A0A7Y0L4K2_9FIRM|nr:asparaginase [Sulfobacillus harzensis]NMP23219.1 asparaginase [Sulfobacillus harzensis]
MSETAIELWRGGRMESRIRADVAVVDSLGTVRYWFGDPHRETYWRSSAKPFQAMPIIMSGGAEQYHFGPREVAIVCASHGGQPMHVELVQDLLKRIDATPEDLICGVHPPSDRESARALMVRGDEPVVLHNNCSGKHTGMLTLARALKAPLAGYEKPEHPVQQAIRQNVAYMTGLDGDSLHTGIDGCGVPTFYLPLTRMAYSYARLVDPRGLDPAHSGAALIISEAMRMHPDLVSGTGRLEVTLAEATDHRLVSKGGAEAVFCIGIPDKGLGLAVKIDDGYSRVMPTLVTAVLNQIGVLGMSEQVKLEEQLHPEIRNHAGTLVGEICPVLALQSGRLN